MPTVVRSSRLRAAPEAVWDHATRMAGVNREMGPWLRMTYPRAFEGRTLADAADHLGEPLFPSWVLFLGLLPVERMQVTITALEPGRRFVEQSGVTFQRGWRHERTVEPADGGCVVTDRLDLEPRFRVLGPFLGWFLGAFFAHRHRRLRAFFGS